MPFWSLLEYWSSGASPIVDFRLQIDERAAAWNQSEIVNRKSQVSALQYSIIRPKAWFSRLGFFTPVTPTPAQRGCPAPQGS